MHFYSPKVEEKLFQSVGVSILRGLAGRARGTRAFSFGNRLLSRRGRPATATAAATALATALAPAALRSCPRRLLLQRGILCWCHGKDQPRFEPVIIAIAV